jgi:hypothetical protein
MSIRPTKQEIRERDRLAAALRDNEAEVAAQFERLLDALRAAPAALNSAIRTRNLVAQEAAAFAETVHDRLRDEYDEKSERWQEGDAGQEASSLIDEWDNVDVSQVGEVQIVEPELEGNEGADALSELPAEPS